MDTKKMCATIDVSALDFSMLILTPKQAFLEWLETFKIKIGLGHYKGYSLHCSEEDTVLLIPKIERFSEPGAYGEFLSEIKPRLLMAELNRFGATEADFGHPITKETFDEFFDLALRNEATPISVLFKEHHSGAKSE
jgi:hypothetical protein